mmetsp:Transcript_5290/g.10887  ORF Transcript_5290/g.10887 Transcript_5290/m.10887 type:complete len:292 (-) Transcript_5290:566-1441(-)
MVFWLMVKIQNYHLHHLPRLFARANITPLNFFVIDQRALCQSLIHIRRRMALAQLGFIVIAPILVDAPSPLHGGPALDRLGPSNHVGIILGDVEKFPRIGTVQVAQHQRAVPWEDGHVGNGIRVATNKRLVLKLIVQHIQLSFGLHGESINGILLLFLGVDIEMTKAAAHKGSRSHLPKQPIHDFHALLRRQKGMSSGKLVGQIDEDTARLKDSLWFVAIVVVGVVGCIIVQQCWYFGIGINGDKSTAELIAFHDIYQPCIVFRLLNAGGQELLQQNGHLLSIGRAQAVEL